MLTMSTLQEVEEEEEEESNVEREASWSSPPSSPHPAIFMHLARVMLVAWHTGLGPLSP